ncbi:Retrovirus-related Pol polyprotein from transposon RE1 [Sesamum angolense]|uniref:Retrovirus-related Pol polyprotein from transposon RE1 n=1 Tax=Sesamum angolense TaxID=2727404 RepID=A0AAE1T7R5_9LAMI|nr:Retrovirus-related Pol polyprotein from transposon RE1 [Sesamum angolense]
MVVGGASTGATKGYVYVQPQVLTIYGPCDWLIDTGANVYVCADKSLFMSYQAIISGRTISMENSSTTEVLGMGSVDLKFPSGLILSLKRVHHVSTVRRNIISGIEVNTIVEFCDVVLHRRCSYENKNTLSVSLDDSLISTSIPEYVEKMTNVGVNPSSSTSLTYEELGEPRRKAKQWKEAAKSEMDSIISNETWKLVDLPPGYTTIGCKWIFKKKQKPDGSVDKFKARLVAKGFKQKKGIDYFDTYYAGTKVPEGHSVTGLTLWQIPVVLEGYSDASLIAKNSGSNGVQDISLLSLGM